MAGRGGGVGTGAVLANGGGSLPMGGERCGPCQCGIRGGGLEQYEMQGKAVAPGGQYTYNILSQDLVRQGGS